MPTTEQIEEMKRKQGLLQKPDLPDTPNEIFPKSDPEKEQKKQEQEQEGWERKRQKEIKKFGKKLNEAQKDWGKKEPEKKQEIEIIPSESIMEDTVIKTKQLVDYLTKYNLLPDAFRDKQTKKYNHAMAALAVEQGKALGAKNVGEAVLMVKFMYHLNGVIHIWGDLPLSLIYQSELVDTHEEYFLDKTGKKICEENENVFEQPEACVVRAKRKGGVEQRFMVTAEDLKLSGGTRLEDGSFSFPKGHYKTPSDTWKKYYKIHWQRRTRAFSLKTVYPDKIQGVGLADYDDVPKKIEVIEDKPKKIEMKEELSQEKADELYKALNPEQKENWSSELEMRNQEKINKESIKDKVF